MMREILRRYALHHLPTAPVTRHSKAA